MFRVTSSQALSVLSAFFLDAMQPLEFLFLLAQFLNHALHRRGHERRTVFDARRRAHLVLVSFARVLEKPPDQVQRQPGNRGQDQRQGNPQRLQVRWPTILEHC
jgi:hypothetical protein